MRTLIPDEVKQVNFCNSAVQAAWPHSVIGPVLFGVGMEIDHTFGSRWLIAELSRLGSSVTYDEVVRYKQSVLHNDSELRSKDAPFHDNFTQFVADNVDGKGTFHDMGIIAVSTKTEARSENLRGRAVKRFKRSGIMDVVHSNAGSYSIVSTGFFEILA